MISHNSYEAHRSEVTLIDGGVVEPLIRQLKDSASEAVRVVS